MKYKNEDFITIRNDKKVFDKIRGRRGRIIFSGTDKTSCYGVEFGEKYPIVVEESWILGKENQDSFKLF